MSLPPSALSAVVSDAGPLISLGRLDLLGALFAQFAQVQLPRAVLDECLARPTQIDAIRIRHAVDVGRLIVCDAVPITADELDLGERAAIGRTLEIGAGLLVDDRDARAWTEAHGLAVIGTSGVLVRARHRGLIPALTPLIEQLRADGQRLSAEAIAAALDAAGEPPA